MCFTHSFIHSPPTPLLLHPLTYMYGLCIAGTDATMAEHIKTVQQRSYVRKTSNSELVPTTLGIALVDGECCLGGRTRGDVMKHNRDSHSYPQLQWRVLLSVYVYVCVCVCMCVYVCVCVCVFGKARTKQSKCSCC